MGCTQEEMGRAGGLQSVFIIVFFPEFVKVLLINYYSLNYLLVVDDLVNLHESCVLKFHYGLTTHFVVCCFVLKGTKWIEIVVLTQFDSETLLVSDTEHIDRSKWWKVRLHITVKSLKVSQNNTQQNP